MGDFELDLALDLNGHLSAALRLHEFYNSASFTLDCGTYQNNIRRSALRV